MANLESLINTSPLKSVALQLVTCYNKWCDTLWQFLHAPTTDVWWLFPKFFMSNIVFGTCLFQAWKPKFFVEKTKCSKPTMPRWVLNVLIGWPKMPQKPLNLLAQSVCPSPKLWDIIEKRLYRSSVVCAYMSLHFARSTYLCIHI